jgi:hypothetical protein
MVKINFLINLVAHALDLLIYNIYLEYKFYEGFLAPKNFYGPYTIKILYFLLITIVLKERIKWLIFRAKRSMTGECWLLKN